MKSEVSQLLNKLSTYTYGILYNDGKFISDKEETNRRDGTDIIVQTPQMMDDHKAGMCHDASIYVDKFLTALGVEHTCVYIASNVEPMLPTHSFIIMRDDEEGPEFEPLYVIDVFAYEDCIWKKAGTRDGNMTTLIEERVAEWIKNDNGGSADLEVFVLDHMPEGGKGFVEYSKEVVDAASDFEFNYGYSHLEYEGTGIYQALKRACGWDWKDVIRSKDISWLPKPPDYSGRFESFFTMKGYHEFKQKVMPIVREYLDESKIVEKYVEKIDIRSIVYSDEFQVVVKRKFNRFSRLFENIMEKIQNSSTIDCDDFLNEDEEAFRPIWSRQFNLLNEYVEDPELIPVPKQVLIDFVKDLRTKNDSIKTFSYEEIYIRLHEHDYEYSEEFKENLLKYNIFNGHLTIAILQNNDDVIHKYLDEEFDFIKVDEIISKMKNDPTGMTDSWSRDLSDEEVVQKNVVILVNRSLIIHGQDWKDTIEHEMTHFIQRIVGLDKSLKKKMKYFGQKVDERLEKFKENILNKTKLSKSNIDAALCRFFAYVTNPIEHDSSIKSCLNAFQREYELSRSKMNRNEWLDAKLKILDYEFDELFDKYFLMDKKTITSYDEMMKHKFLFAILTYKTMTCLGYDMNEKLRNHFKIFKYRDI